MLIVRLHFKSRRYQSERSAPWKLRFSAVLLLCLAALMACTGDRSDGPKRQPGPNRPSVGFIDLPMAGSTVDPLVRVSGWAVDESGIKAVRIYFDDELMATVELVLARPDVDLAFPQFTKPGALHGFNTIVPARAHAGYTLIRTEAIDGLGALTPLYSVTVKIRE